MKSSGFDQARLGRVADFADRYVAEGKVAGVQVQVAHEGKVALRHTVGLADIDAGLPLRDDAIFRLYSMTKPVTSIALMQLYEQGLVLLEDPVSRYIPEFADVRVWAGGTVMDPRTRPCIVPMKVHDVLRHTSGLTYGFLNQHAVDALYRADGLGDFVLPELSLAEAMKLLAAKPLLFEPGTAWNYSVSTDVCGRIVEVISGQPLDEYFDEHILGPLGMRDTGFSVPPEKADRFVSNYLHVPGSGVIRVDPHDQSTYAQPPAFLSGGGGLVGTTDDYQRFCDMLLAGGALDGRRVIGRRTLEYMTLNHLPGGRLLNEMGQSLFSETVMEGMGFGLGFSVMVDPAANGAISSVGEFAWGGAASTAFFVDPVERVTAIFMTQFMPSSYYPIRRLLRSTVYQALF